MTRIVGYSRLPLLAYEHHYRPDEPSHCLVIKAVYQWDDEGHLTLLPRQPDWVLQDQFEGEPYRSSLRVQSDLTPRKPATDVTVVGKARPRDDKPVPAWLAALEVGPIKKVLRLTGPRAWRWRLTGGWKLDAPEPTEAVPLCFELAYGGLVETATGRQVFEANPLGRGFWGEAEPPRDQAHPAAQIESPDNPIQSISKIARSVSCSPLADFFSDRCQFAGTPTDDPTPPDDFQLDFWQSAPLDQRAVPYLQGGEVLRLIGFTPNGEVRLKLPQYRMRAILKWTDTLRETQLLDLDTVQVDLDARTLSLRWYTAIPFDEQLEEIAVLDTIDLLAASRAENA
ncbi:DUF2169 family type VI secretion system accessory protein [Chitinimonas lacunae]|uniref:DUF2169 domain-containing protein n=1 Tax=Chitinimonas lacunae TaxID=1963018 RepID=A0ABV8MY32_9NEIS